MSAAAREPIVTLPPDERVVATAADEPIVALATVQDVTAVAAGERVFALSAHEPVVAVAAGEPVVAGAPGERVLAQTAFQDVMALAPRNPVVALAADNRVIAAAAIDAQPHLDALVRDDGVFASASVDDHVPSLLRGELHGPAVRGDRQPAVLLLANGRVVVARAEVHDRLPVLVGAYVRPWCFEAVLRDRGLGLGFGLRSRGLRALGLHFIRGRCLLAGARRLHGGRRALLRDLGHVCFTCSEVEGIIQTPHPLWIRQREYADAAYGCAYGGDLLGNSAEHPGGLT
nr:hypothetical protein [Hyalangium gracile]